MNGSLICSVSTQCPGVVERREVVDSAGSRDRNDGKVGVRVPPMPGSLLDQSEPASIPKQLRFAKTSYMPPMPSMPPPPGIWPPAFSSSGFSTTTASVVSSSPAIEAAFWSAMRTTLVGSITPAWTRFS